ncbi:MAG: hypothetical protein AAFV29_21110, partial [Myxococcota bacterium]
GPDVTRPPLPVTQIDEKLSQAIGHLKPVPSPLPTPASPAKASPVIPSSKGSNGSSVTSPKPAEASASPTPTSNSAASTSARPGRRPSSSSASRPPAGVFASFFQEAAAADVDAKIDQAVPAAPEIKPPTPDGAEASQPDLPHAERRKRRMHRNASVGVDPDLDHKIAMARARVVRQPKDIAAGIELSFLLSSRGDQQLLEEAIDVVRRVAALDPDHAGAQYRLAELFARKGDYRLARDHLAQAKRLGFIVDTDFERVVADGIKAG